MECRSSYCIMSFLSFPAIKSVPFSFIKFTFVKNSVKTLLNACRILCLSGLLQLNQFIHPGTLFAQCCSGNLSGQELIYNGDFSLGFDGFLSSYTRSDASQPGRYGIVNNSKEANQLYWEGCRDHTDGSGTFLWADLSESSSQIIWTQQVTGVQPHTYYLLSCWVSTLSVEGPATVSFSINGRPVGKPFRAPDETCKWVRFCTLWYSGNSVKARISIDNLSKSAGGNDIGIDDISLQIIKPPVYYRKDVHICEGSDYLHPDGRTTSRTTIFYDTLSSFFGCDSITATRVKVHDTSTQYIKIPLCGGASYKMPDGRDENRAGVYAFRLKSVFGCDSPVVIILTTHDQLKDSVDVRHVSCYGLQDGEVRLFSLNGDPPFRYTLHTRQQTGSGLFPNTGAGTYPYSITDANGCRTDGNVTVEQPDKITIYIERDKSVMEFGLPAQIRVASNYPEARFQWSPSAGLSCDTCKLVHAAPVKNSVYTVTAIVRHGTKLCRADTLIEVLLQPFVFVPSSFTPNGDGLNDVFTPGGFAHESFESFELNIYNAWGAEVYSSTDSAKGWDGMSEGVLAPQGVYLWKIVYTVRLSGERKFINGTCTLLR